MRAPWPGQAVLTVLTITLSACQTLAAPPAAAPTSAGGERPGASPTVEILHVYDGDSLTLTDGRKVRLLAVNTPERHPAEPLADEARDFAIDFLSRGPVRLTVGPSPQDGYGRVLASLHTPSGDLATALTRAGLAHVFAIPPLATDLGPLLAAQGEAQREGLGIWSTTAFRGPLHITSFHANARGDDEANVNGEYVRVCNLTLAPVELEGWTLHVRSSDRRLALPALSLPAGHTVQVRAGLGTTQSDPRRQLAVYLQQPAPIFSNDGETVTLAAPDGTAIDARAQKGG